MERKHFDELMEFYEVQFRYGKISDNTLDIMKEKLKQMFPQFSQPKFRKCVLCEKVDEQLRADESVFKAYKQIDTTSFPIVVDDEGNVLTVFKGAYPKESYAIKFKKDGSYSIINYEEAQQILSFLKEEGDG